MMSGVRVVIWIVEGTWQGCVDAAVTVIPPGAEIALLHHTPTDAAEAADAASANLLGRARFGHRPAPAMHQIAAEEATKLLAAAAARLGRGNVEQLHIEGARVEREVVRAVAEHVDLLVAARDGDRSRLGPHSLGHATRFVVDHAPCAVLLVWPDESPGLGSIPPPPPPPPAEVSPPDPAPRRAP
jgi:nucleotide-binding universal stress UspA family protein